MSNFQAKIQAYYDLHPIEFYVLHSLSIYQGIGTNGVFGQRVCIVLGRNIDETSARLYLDFDGVRNLRIQQPEWSQISLDHVQIVLVPGESNMKDRFHVHDNDQDSIISFDCQEFQAIVG